MENALTRRPTVAQVLVGVFILWQIGYMVTANIVGFSPSAEQEKGELSNNDSGDTQELSSGQKAIAAVHSFTERYAYLTGQTQAWWLFAPEVPKQATFPVVELRWNDPKDPDTAVQHQPVRLQSTLEPQDPDSYFRPPGSFDRLFHYEVRLGLVFTGWNRDSVTAHPEEWLNLVQERVMGQANSIRAYLRWRTQQYLREHPDLPGPRQVVLYIHIYKTPQPGLDPRDREGPSEQALARWLPGQANGTALPLVEVCDPVTNQFVRMRLRDQSP